MGRPAPSCHPNCRMAGSRAPRTSAGRAAARRSGGERAEAVPDGHSRARCVSAHAVDTAHRPSRAGDGDRRWTTPPRGMTSQACAVRVPRRVARHRLFGRADFHHCGVSRCAGPDLPDLAASRRRRLVRGSRLYSRPPRARARGDAARVRAGRRRRPVRGSGAAPGGRCAFCRGDADPSKPARCRAVAAKASGLAGLAVSSGLDRRGRLRQRVPLPRPPAARAQEPGSPPARALQDRSARCCIRACGWGISSFRRSRSRPFATPPAGSAVAARC